MATLASLAGLAVTLSAIWLLGLGLAILIAPAQAASFLSAFASSARAHYTEQLLRLIAGLALIHCAPRMRLSAAFAVFGWVLAVTAAALLLVPWRWHHRFGKWVIPLAIRHLKLIAVGSFALGALILYGLLG